MNKILYPREDHRLFEVPGAGFLGISEDCNFQCGGEKGFSIGASWGQYGYAGGVLPIEAAKELAELIFKAIEIENSKPKAND